MRPIAEHKRTLAYVIIYFGRAALPCIIDVDTIAPARCAREPPEKPHILN
jgi:hypothetical protein